MFFMITAATILEEMTRDMITNPLQQVDYKLYENKIQKYKPTLEGIFEDFEDSVFGVFYNRRPRETFVEMLAVEGWKYFQVKNLNELFALMLQRHGIDEEFGSASKVEAVAIEDQETKGKTDPVIRSGTLTDSARPTTEKKDNQWHNEKKPEESKIAAKESLSDAVLRELSKKEAQGEPLQTVES